MPTIHPLAGQPAPESVLVDVDALRRDYYERKPDTTDATQRVSFGTSGHRGSSLRGTFNEAHILAITQAICSYRRTNGVTGPLYVGKDTHALSQQAFESVVEVLSGNSVDTDHRWRWCIHTDSRRVARHPDPQSGTDIRSCGRYRDHPVPQSARRRGIQVQPAARRAGRDRCHSMDRARSESAPVGRSRWHHQDSVSTSTQRRHDPSLRLSRYLCRRSRLGRGHGRHSKRRAEDRCRSAGRRERGLLAADPGTARPESGSRQRRRGPDVPLHVSGLGRQDPNGLLVAACHGGVDRIEGSLRHRVWKRPRQ